MAWESIFIGLHLCNEEKEQNVRKNYKFPFAKKKGSLFGCLQCLSGRNGGVRTRDLLVPNQAHYQAVLRPVANQRFGARVIISLAKG